MTVYVWENTAGCLAGIPVPRTYDGTNISWWTFQPSYRLNEFSDMCMAYDDLLHNVYLYAISDGASRTSGSR